MCFSLEWWRDLLILAVVVSAIIAILQILVPYVLRRIGWAGSEHVAVLTQVIRIVIWAIIVIAVIYVVFALISCLLGYTGAWPLFPRR
jgi:ABC-type maltose transport system permease subunit